MTITRIDAPTRDGQLMNQVAKVELTAVPVHNELMLDAYRCGTARSAADVAV